MENLNKIGIKLALALALITVNGQRSTVYGQEPETFNVTIHDSNGGTHTESFELPLSMTYPIDSLLADWKAKNFIDLGKDCSTSDENPLFSDSIYIDRLSRIPAIIEMPYNEVVREFIEKYTSGRLRQRMSLMLSLSNFYIPMFEEALYAYDLPLELKYLPIIESALNPNAISRAGASGLWQFMLGTGKLYGLENNSYVDERQDPIKSTWAAVRYLKDMYDIYKDWNLAIAAYNCGPGNVNKAISRSGKRDYWEIYNYLPKETRGYVPSFIAANYVMTYYCNHNICPMETNMPEATDTIQVNHNVHFQQIADICGVDIDMIKSLNPQYKRSIIPGDSKPQTLRLPQNYIGMFIEKQDTIYAHRANEFFRNRKVVAVPQQNARQQRTSTQRTTAATPASGTATTHKIKSGETLSGIASRYGVTVNQLKSWNGISGTRINAGQTLKIYK
ncbi:MAG: transglycosylase SLT domain-containing protein [Bacteroidaceae bacterium]|nr:transglycosylase SLT domain-containing protein [Bacteroidaceae bacterium]